jgi:hypothetical protein
VGWQGCRVSGWVRGEILEEVCVMFARTGVDLIEYNSTAVVRDED